MRLISIFFGLSLALSLLALGLTYFNLGGLNADLILRYDDYRGVDRFGSIEDAYLIIGLGVGLSLINYLLAAGLFKKQPVSSLILALSGFFVASLILIAIIAIIANN